MSKVNKSIIPDEIVITKIYLIRGQKVMLDFDLAELYGVETRVLKQAVRRNVNRFPDDFMFDITKEELENLRSQIVISSWGGSRYLPAAFTEHGVLMLSSVLKSDRAIEMNIQIVRIFNKMKEMLLTHKDILLKLEKIEYKLLSHDEDIAVLFSYLKQVLKSEDQKKEQSSRKRIGFKKD
jgi:ORF6N domain